MKKYFSILLVTLTFISSTANLAHAKKKAAHKKEVEEEIYDEEDEAAEEVNSNAVTNNRQYQEQAALLINSLRPGIKLIEYSPCNFIMEETIDNGSIRIYFNLGELDNHPMTFNKAGVINYRCYYEDRCVDGVLTKWDAVQHLEYITIKFKNIETAVRVVPALNNLNNFCRGSKTPPLNIEYELNYR